MNEIGIWFEKIISPNLPLISFIVVFFLVGCGAEFYSFWRNWGKLKRLDLSIAYLTDALQGGKQQISKPQPESQDEQHYSWVRQHIEGIEKIAETEKNRRYIYQLSVGSSSLPILLSYPIELATISRSNLTVIPTILTALGILGTFWGITTGIQGVEINSSNVEASLDSTLNLLDGMGTAFSTSLMGLSCSLLFSLVITASNYQRRRYCYDLRDRLGKVAALKPPTQSSQELYRSSQELYSIVEGLPQRIGETINLDPMQNAAQDMQKAARILARFSQQLETQFNAEKIGQAVGGQIGIVFEDLLATHLRPVFVQIEESQTRLEGLNADQQTVLRDLIGNMRTELIEPVATRLDTSADMTERASQAVERLHIELADLADRLARSIATLTNTVETIETFQNRTLEQLQRFTQHLEITLTEFQTNTKEVLQETAKEIRSGTIDILQQAEITFQKQSDTLAEIGQEASSLMATARIELITSLGSIDQRLQDISEATQKQLEAFRLAYQDNLQDFFTQQNNLLEGTLGQQRNSLAAVVENLNLVFQQEYGRRSELNQGLDDRIKLIAKTIKDVNKLVATSETLYTQDKLDLLQTLADRLAESDRELESIARQNQKMRADWTQELNQYVESLAQERKQFFNDADTAMAQVSGKLLETAKLIADLLSEMPTQTTDGNQEN